MSLEIVQTPSKDILGERKQNLVGHYVSIIEKNIDTLKALVSHLVADGYFMKYEFIMPVLSQGLHVITKMRADANLRYIYNYNGPKKKGRGRFITSVKNSFIL